MIALYEMALDLVFLWAAAKTVLFQLPRYSPYYEFGFITSLNLNGFSAATSPEVD